MSSRRSVRSLLGTTLAVVVLAGCTGERAPTEGASAQPGSPSATPATPATPAPTANTEASDDGETPVSGPCRDDERIAPATADDVAWIETVSKAIAAAEPAERLQCLGGTNPRDNAGVFDLDPHAAHFASVRVGVVTRRMPSGAESIERVFEVRFTPEGMPTVEAIERVIGPTEKSTQSPHGPPGRHAYRGGGLRVLLDLERGAGTAAKVTAIRVDNQGPQ
jgi:hypothetical protein